MDQNTTKGDPITMDAFNGQGYDKFKDLNIVESIPLVMGHNASIIEDPP